MRKIEEHEDLPCFPCGKAETGVVDGVIFAGEFIAYQKTTLEENIFAVKLAELTRDVCRL